MMMMIIQKNKDKSSRKSKFNNKKLRKSEPVPYQKEKTDAESRLVEIELAIRIITTSPITSKYPKITRAPHFSSSA